MLVKLIFKNIRKNKFIGIISIFSLSIFISSFIATSLLLKISLQTISSFWFDNQKNKFLIEKNTHNFSFLNITENLSQVYKDLQSNKNIKEIRWIYKIYLPASLEINFLNLNFQTDIGIFASDKWDLCFSWKYLAAGINPNILAIYNLELAWWNYPKISKETLSEIPLTLIFWKNSFYNSENFIKEKAKIVATDKNRPLLGLTIWYKPAKEIIRKLWGKIELIKLVGYVKNTNFIKKLTTMYPNFKIITYLQTQKNINKWKNIISKTFWFINLIIVSLGIVFLIFMITLIKEKNKNILETLKNNQASKVQLILYSYWEIIIYIILSLILSYLIISLLNNQLIHIENFLYQNWIILKI